MFVAVIVALIALSSVWWKWSYAYLPPQALTRRWLPIPLISHTIELLYNQYYFADMAKIFGSLFRVHTVLGEHICIAKSEALKWFLKQDGRSVDWKLPNHWEALLGPHSIFSVKGDHHKHLRKVLMQAFTPKSVEGYVPMAERATRSFLHHVLEKSKIAAPFEFYPEAKRHAMNIALEIIFSRDMDSDDRLRSILDDFVTWFKGLEVLVPINVPGTTFYYALQARQRILATCKSFLDERRHVEEEESDKCDVLQNLVSARDEQGNSLSDGEILDTLLGFILAGHDTSTATMCTSIVGLSLIEGTPFEENLIKEVDTLFGDASKPTDYNAMSSAQHLDAFLKEILRWCAPIGTIMRNVIKDVEYECPVSKTASAEGACPMKYRLRAGQPIFFAYSTVMNDEDVYTKPREFDPERFLPERQEDKNAPGAYVPFGGGIRMCLGMGLAKMELKLFLVHLIRAYRVQVSSHERLVFPIQLYKPLVSFTEREATIVIQ